MSLHRSTPRPTGLSKLGTRYNQPETDRFIHTDSAYRTEALPFGNEYLYASASPATYSDPSGAIPNDCAAILAGGATLLGIRALLTSGLAAGVYGGYVSATAATVAGGFFDVAATAASTSLSIEGFMRGCA